MGCACVDCLVARCLFDIFISHEPKILVNTMKIDQAQEVDYDSVKINYVGLVDPYGIEGIVILKADNDRVFHMRAFSGDVARQIMNLGSTQVQEREDEIPPSIYKMIEEICEENELVLVKIKVYESGKVLRANLYFTGKKDLVLKNYRASDAIALAVFYNIPILVRKNLLKEEHDV